MSDVVLSDTTSGRTSDIFLEDKRIAVTLREILFRRRASRVFSHVFSVSVCPMHLVSSTERNKSITFYVKFLEDSLVLFCVEKKQKRERERKLLKFTVKNHTVY